MGSTEQVKYELYALEFSSQYNQIHTLDFVEMDSIHCKLIVRLIIQLFASLFCLERYEAEDKPNDFSHKIRIKSHLWRPLVTLRSDMYCIQ